MVAYIGTSGNDTFPGSGTADIAFGRGGDDILNGLGGSDTIVGEAGRDTLNGGEGDDTLYAGDQTPTFHLPYDDVRADPLLDTGSERDILTGGGGDDRVFAGYGDDADGGSQVIADTLYISFLAAPSGVTADFRSNLSVGGGVIQGFEKVLWIQGSNFGDTINAQSPTFQPMAEAIDYGVVMGMGGDDYILGGYNTYAIYGDDGDDLLDLRASANAGRVEGGNGADTIYSGGGTAYGGAGNDQMLSAWWAFGGVGDDLIVVTGTGNAHGDEGDDEIIGVYDGLATGMLVGGEGADTITVDGGRMGAILVSGGSHWVNGTDTYDDDNGFEHDRLTGGMGDDILIIGLGDDADGGDGDEDFLFLSLAGLTSGVTLDTTGLVGGGPVSLAGGVIQNIEFLGVLRATEFDDVLTIARATHGPIIRAGGGNDLITADGPVDVRGEAGNDRLLVSSNQRDVFDGGDGVDTIDYSSYAAAIAVHLKPTWHDYGESADGDLLRGVENIIGTLFNDSLDGDDADNAFTGGLGDDAINGFGGSADTAIFSGLRSAYTITRAASGVVTVTGLDGVDTLTNIEALTFQDGTLLVSALPPPGTSGADVMNGTSGSDRLEGLGGNDALYGQGGDDVLIGGVGNDVLSGGAGTDTVDYTAVSTNITGNAASTWVGTGDGFYDQVTGMEVWRLGSGNDTLITYGAQETVYGGAGNDWVGDYGVNQNNTFYGEDGDDSLYGLGGSDVLWGGTGADFLVGGDGADYIIGGAGIDWMDGQGGADTFFIYALSEIQGGWEAIANFQSGVDKLNVQYIDADGNAGNGDTAFTVTTTGFTNTAGQIYIERPGGQNYAFVRFDTNGDSVADALLFVTGTALTSADFIL